MSIAEAINKNMSDMLEISLEESPKAETVQLVGKGVASGLVVLAPLASTVPAGAHETAPKKADTHSGICENLVGEIVNLPDLETNPELNTLAYIPEEDAKAICLLESKSRHVVIKGEVLSTIAKDNGVDLVDMLEANPAITNPDRIFAGQSINIPQEAPSNKASYTAQNNDSFWKIAETVLGPDATKAEVNEAHKKLLTHNGGKATIYPGQIIDVSVIGSETSEKNDLRKHIVQDNESPYSIAQDMIGRPDDTEGRKAVKELAEKIIALNGIEVRGKRAVLDPGQQITVPAIEAPVEEIADESIKETLEAEAQKLPNTFIPKTGTISSNEAGFYGTDVETFAAAYSLESPDKLIAGHTYDNRFKEDGSSNEFFDAPVDEEVQVASVSENSIDFGPVSNRVLRDWEIPMGSDTPYETEDDVNAFIQKVEEISADLGFSPDYLMAVMKFESARSFDPAIKNPLGSASGLIQCVERYCAEPLGYTIKEVRAMSPIEQLEKIVHPYFASSKGQLKTLFDVYLKVFYPNAIGKGPDYVLPLTVKEYRANSGFDTDKNGLITVREISKKLLDIYNSAPVILHSENEEDKNESTVEDKDNNNDSSDKSSDGTAEVEQNDGPEQEDSPEIQTPTVPQPEVVEPHHSYVDQSTIETNSDGVQVVRLKDNAGNTFGDEISLEIANDAAGLLEAAEQAGFRFYILSGARTVAEQERLRAEHGCPGDLVYDRSCRPNPPTAIPGRSNHNDGKALDLRLGLNGSTKLEKGSPAFEWLKSHAEEFGFKNLPSEPWHWSVNGQ